MKKYLVVVLVCLFLSIGLKVGYSNTKKTGVLTVLTYHHIQAKGTFDEVAQGSVIVTPEQLEKQLTYFKVAGYNTVTSQDIEDHYKGTKVLPANPLVITFDDGYNSNYEYLFPLLKKLNMKATIFVPAILIRDENLPGSGNPAFITWQQAKEMVESGHVDIQSHTYDLHKTVTVGGKETPALTTRQVVQGRTETDREYKIRIKNDIERSVQVIQSYLGNRVSALAFPFGEYNRLSREACSETGIRLMFSTEEGVNEINRKPLIFKRITVNQKHSGQEIGRIKRKYCACGPVPFADIENHWAEEAIVSSLVTNLFAGYNDKQFRPDSPVTRAELLTLLNVIKPLPQSHDDPKFNDLLVGAWYYQTVQKAAAAGIVQGYPDHSFRPNRPMNRQEAVTVICNYLFSQQAHDEMTLDQFSDAAEVPEWAKDSFAKLVH